MLKMPRWLAAVLLIGPTGFSASAQDPLPASPLPNSWMKDGGILKSPPSEARPTSTGVLQASGVIPPALQSGSGGCIDCAGGLSGPNCCGPTGGNGPILSDVYVRTGPNFPFGGGIAKGLKNGWGVQVGGRSLFVNPEGSAAWVVDLHVFYTGNKGNNAGIYEVRSSAFADRQPQRGALTRADGTVLSQTLAFNIKNYDRSGVGVGFGRDYFMPGVMNGAASFGFDIGGRWGASHVDLVAVDNVNRDPGSPFDRQRLVFREYDVFAEAFAALNAKWEIPMGTWAFTYGVRGEYAMTFTDIVPTSGTFSNFNVFLSAGIRY